ncbi:MAG: hypothetical protein GY861_17305 [bacterium]|nr:hypothetical protein [bacterium]
MKKILIIGVGGIGSFLSRELNRLILNNQIDLDNVDITIADDDEVETKNIKYQNFIVDDVFKKKVDVIAKRYSFNRLRTRIKDGKELNGYDLIIVAVDNAKTRKMVFDYCYNTRTYFIDLRAEGRAVAFFTREMDEGELLSTLSFDKGDKGSSCQLEYELKNDIIQNGNLVIATMGSQLVLNWLRKEKNPDQFIMRI